jgi:hypothetical protein
MFGGNKAEKAAQEAAARAQVDRPVAPHPSGRSNLLQGLQNRLDQRLAVAHEGWGSRSFDLTPAGSRRAATGSCEIRLYDCKDCNTQRSRLASLAACLEVSAQCAPGLTSHDGPEVVDRV